MEPGCFWLHPSVVRFHHIANVRSKRRGPVCFCTGNHLLLSRRAPRGHSGPVTHQAAIKHKSTSSERFFQSNSFYFTRFSFLFALCWNPIPAFLLQGNASTSSRTGGSVTWRRGRRTGPGYWSERSWMRPALPPSRRPSHAGKFPSPSCKVSWGSEEMIAG